jgi:hypothetical protein
MTVCSNQRSLFLCCVYICRRNEFSTYLSRAKFVLTNHTLVPIGFIFNPILRSIAIHREQADDGVLASRLVIDAPTREELHSLVYAVFVFVVGHLDKFLNRRKNRGGSAACGAAGMPCWRRYPRRC